MPGNGRVGRRVEARVLHRAVLAAGLLCGCPANAEYVLPPSDELFYPTGIAVAPDESVLFVANANSQLRYNAGTLVVVDLALVDEVVAAWLASGVIADGCAVDAEYRERLVCDEARFLRPSAARIGNFATNISVQDLGGGRARVFVPTRGDPSVSWAEWDGSLLACADEADAFVLCDAAHRLVFVQDDPELGGLPAEPFDIVADAVENVALVTHLTSGAVSLIDSPPDGVATIADVLTGIFAADSNDDVGASGVAAHTLAGNTVFYVGSPYEDRVQTFTVGHPVNGASPYLLPAQWIFLDSVGGFIGGSSDTRALAFGGGGDTLYDLNRDPPSLQIMDTSLDATGTARNAITGAIDVCRGNERLAPLPTTDGERVYLTCFDDGEVYVIDPRGAGYVQEVLLTGRGPYGIAAAPGRRRVYVSNVLEDTLSVIDAAPASATRDRVVLKLGVPSYL